MGLMLIAGCKKEAPSRGGMTEAQVSALVTRLMAERTDAGVATRPLPASGAARTSTGATSATDGRRQTAEGDHGLVATPCLSVSGQEKVQRTAALLVALDDLMADFRPQAPTLPERPESCLSDVAVNNDPARAQYERAHLAEVQAQRRTMMAAAQQAEANYRSLRPLSYLWIRGWNGSDGSDVVLRAASYHCVSDCTWFDQTYDESSCRAAHRRHLSGNRGCDFSWVVNVPSLRLTTGTAELIRRLSGRSDLHLESEQFCSIGQARISADNLVLICNGPRAEESFRVRVPAVLGARGAALGDVGIGDLVRFNGHGALWKKFDERTPYWEFWRFDGADASIVERSTCCAAPAPSPDAGAVISADAEVPQAEAAAEGSPRRHHRH